MNKNRIIAATLAAAAVMSNYPAIPVSASNIVAEKWEMSVPAYISSNEIGTVSIQGDFTETDIIDVTSDKDVLLSGNNEQKKVALKFNGISLKGSDSKKSAEITPNIDADKNEYKGNVSYYLSTDSTYTDALKKFAEYEKQIAESKNNITDDESKVNEAINNISTNNKDKINDALDTLVEKRDTIENNINKNNSAINDLEKTADTVKDEEFKTDAEKQIASLKNEIDELKEKLESLNNKIDQLNSLLDSYENQKEKQSAYDKEKENLDKIKDSVNESISEKEDIVTEKNNAKNNADEVVSQAKSDVNKAQQKLEKAEKALEDAIKNELDKQGGSTEITSTAAMSGATGYKNPNNTFTIKNTTMPGTSFARLVESTIKLNSNDTGTDVYWGDECVGKASIVYKRFSDLAKSSWTLYENAGYVIVPMGTGSGNNIKGPVSATKIDLSHAIGRPAYYSGGNSTQKWFSASRYKGDKSGINVWVSNSYQNTSKLFALVPVTADYDVTQSSGEEKTEDEIRAELEAGSYGKAITDAQNELNVANEALSTAKENRETANSELDAANKELENAKSEGQALIDEAEEKVEQAKTELDEANQNKDSTLEDTQKDLDNTGDEPSGVSGDNAGDTPSDTPSDTPGENPSDTPSDTPNDNSIDNEYHNIETQPVASEGATEGATGQKNSDNTFTIRNTTMPNSEFTRIAEDIIQLSDTGTDLYWGDEYIGKADVKIVSYYSFGSIYTDWADAQYEVVPLGTVSASDNLLVSGDNISTKIDLSHAIGRPFGPSGGNKTRSWVSTTRYDGDKDGNICWISEKDLVKGLFAFVPVAKNTKSTLSTNMLSSSNTTKELLDTMKDLEDETDEITTDESLENAVENVAEPIVEEVFKNETETVINPESESKNDSDFESEIVTNSEVTTDIVTEEQSDLEAKPVTKDAENTSANE